MDGFSYWDRGDAVATVFCAGEWGEEAEARRCGVFVGAEAVAMGGVGEEGVTGGEGGEGEAVVVEGRERDVAGGGDEEKLFSVEVLGEEGVS